MLANPDLSLLVEQDVSHIIAELDVVQITGIAGMVEEWLNPHITFEAS